MVKVAQWLICTYLVLKFVQFFFVRTSGFRAAEASFRERILRGEPIVFIVACAISVPPALWSNWYFQRGFEGGLQHSTDCYGRLSALDNLGNTEMKFDPFRVARSIQVARQSVSLAARSLKPPPDDADKLMAEKSSFYTRRYATLSRQGDRREMRAEAAAIERCMSEPMISF